MKHEERGIKQGAASFIFAYFAFKILLHYTPTHREITH